MNKIKIEIKWGLIFSAAALLWMVLERVVGLHSTYIQYHALYTNFFAIIAVAIFIFALRDKKKNYYQGNMDFKQGLLCGVLISVVVALLAPMSQFITHTFISPDYFSNVIRYAVENNLMKQADAEAYFSLKNYVTQATIGALMMGTITSIIVAFFVRTKAVD